jgi:hypothetical protein
MTAREVLQTDMLAPTADAAVVFCIPVYNDWESARLLLELLDVTVAEQGWSASVLFIDDGSLDSVPPWGPLELRGLVGVEVLQLRCNVGHQRAIAVGLTYLSQHRRCEHVVVMDGDGEDAPSDAVKLLAVARGMPQPTAVFAQRSRRLEGAAFRLFYGLYKAAHWLLVGRRVDVGNFSVLPRELLERLVGVGDLWNHYAAAVAKSRLPAAKVPVARARRLCGRSRMSFVSLVSHGLSAMSVYSEEIGVRLLIAASLLVALAGTGLVAVVAIRLLTGLAIPGWATSAAVGLGSLVVNGLLLCLAFSFLVLRGRNASQFVPLRDYSYFIHGVTALDVRR